MADRLPVFYWDTCILLERVKGDVVPATQQRAIQHILNENKGKKNRVVTSVLTHAEAIPKKITAKDVAAEAEYWGYFDGVYFIDQDITRPIISLARELRDFYYVEGDPIKKLPYRMLGLGDSIHLATAIISDVDEFHTRDKKPSGGNVGLLQLPKLSLNGKIGGRWQLKIISPEEAQSDLLDATVPGAR